MSLMLTSYFETPPIQCLIEELIHHFQSIRKESVQSAKFSRAKVQLQIGVDCGINTLINMELIWKQMDPSKIKFNQDIISKVRLYHFLIHRGTLDEFRFKLM